MPVFCAAINCSNRGSASHEVSFFRFPKDRDRCKRWVLNCRRKDLDGKSAIQLNKTFRLCSNHFEETMYYPTNIGGKRLILSAIPTIFDFPDRPARVAMNRKAPPREKLRAHSDTLHSDTLASVSLLDNSVSEDGSDVEQNEMKQSRDDALLESMAEICRLRKEVRRLKLKLKERIQPPCDGSIEHIVHLAEKFLSPGQIKFFHSQLTMSDKIKEETDEL